MRADQIVLQIEEKFTPEEKAEIADQLARAIAELETIHAEKKLSDSAFKDRTNKCDGQVTDLAKRYNKGCEVAQVGCNIRYDFPEPGKKSYIRCDTEELVETHDMSWPEKQETLQFPLSMPTVAPVDGDDKPEPDASAPTPISEITFRHFQDTAAVIVTLKTPEERDAAISEMTEKLAAALLTQGKIADRNGNLELINSLEFAKELAHGWLTACVLMASDDETKSDAAGAAD